jgi:hypothetical protein
VAFEEAATMLDNPLSIVFPDPEHSVGEARWIGVGYSNVGRVLIAACTNRGEVVRIISARRATKKEIIKYEAGRKRRSK